jgi:hypothetical protein
MLKLLLLLFILYVLINNIQKYESFINNTLAKYSYFYSNYFIDKSKYDKILLLGFITDETKKYFETNFPNANINIINVEPAQYTSTSSEKTKIYEGENPYDPNLINELKNNNNIYDIIILEGETIIEKIILSCKYLDILKDTGVFIIQLDTSDTIYNEISLLIKKGFINVKNTIKIFDYSKNNNNSNNMGIIVSIDKSSQ